MEHEQHGPIDAIRSAAYCTIKPAPGTHLTAALLGSPCDSCGHVLALHVGADHCPVCELVALNTKAREGLAAGRVEICVKGRVLTDQYLVGLLEQQARRLGTARYLSR